MSASRIIANRYEITNVAADLIGRGGMGDVYRATDSETGRPVAVKALKPAIIGTDPSIVSRFVREGETLSQLNHPNIVKLLAAIEEDGQHFLIMEYVAGGSLLDLLNREKRLPLRRTLKIALELADALTRAHHLNIIHRDLKPANILLAEDGTPRLTDFGLAYVTNSPRLTQSNIMMGTIGYLSPEACNGQTLDGRTDIWAFGVILYEILTGQHPFQGPTPGATISRILTTPTPDMHQLRAEIGDDIADLIYRMLEKDPHQRIPSIRLVGAELEAILQGSGMIGSRATPLSGQSSTPAQRFATPSPAQTTIVRHNLPNQATQFVGRKDELAELAHLITALKTRLVTILGPGGIGKTRLALEAAGQQLGQFADGVFFVSLSSRNNATEIVTAVAEALDFTFYEGGSPQQQLVDYLREKALLLVLDSFDHVLDAVTFVNDVLLAAPKVQLLATARERLKISQEQTFPLSGFKVPELNIEPSETVWTALQNKPAIQLFLQSARRVQPGFDLNEANLPSLVEICRLVQGMPLGILLAATWIEVLSPAEIVVEINQSLDFLETDQRDMPVRHRSVRAVFDYSWNLLTRTEQDIFRQLSIFRGGFTRQASQAVAEASLRQLMALTNKSLLYRDSNGRYGIARLLRQYAAEKLQKDAALEAAVYERHSRYYARLLADASVDLTGAAQQTALDTVEAESQNARVAWDWALKQRETAVLDQAVDGLGRFYEWRGRYDEGESAARLAAGSLKPAATAEERRILARILTWQSQFTALLGQTEQAGQLLEESLALVKEPGNGVDCRREKASTLLAMSRLALQSGDREKAMALGRESLTLYESLNNPWCLANARYNLGQVAWNLGHYPEAQAAYEASLAIRQKLGDQRGIADVLRSLGLTMMYQGQFAETEKLMRESNLIREKSGDLAGMAVGLGDLGSALLAAGNFTASQTLLEKSLATYTKLGFRQAMAHWGILLGTNYCFLGHYDQAANRAETGYKLAQEVGYPRGMALARWLQGCMALLDKQFDRAEELLRESIALQKEIGQRDELAWSLSTLAKAATEQGNWPEAGRLLSEAFQIAAELKSFLALLFALPGAALLLTRLSEAHETPPGDKGTMAIECYALAARYPTVANSLYLTQFVGTAVQALADRLPADVVRAAEERGRTAEPAAMIAQISGMLG